MSEDNFLCEGGLSQAACRTSSATRKAYYLLKAKGNRTKSGLGEAKNERGVFAPPFSIHLSPSHYASRVMQDLRKVAVKAVVLKSVLSPSVRTLLL